MGFFAALERRLSRFAVQRLSLALVVAWLMAYVLGLGRPEYLELLTLNVDRILDGQWWRTVTFLLIPPVDMRSAISLLWLVIALWLFAIMGGNLEAQLGAFRYNLYVAAVWLLTLGAGVIIDLYAPPGFAEKFPITNMPLITAVFLGFAWLNPNFTLLLFFVLPVKMKWLGLVAWALIALSVASAPMFLKPLALVPALVFLLFFGRAALRRWQGRQRRMVEAVGQVREERHPFHTCSVCGTTDRDDPERLFRVTTDADGEPADICVPCLQERKAREEKGER